ncbi:MAG TPA: sporulation protein YtfJ [Clostridiales bacterium]|jgi:sporulation protein YtfJ|nr:sporulation protein YtfJ [Clostridiales bacterium]
MISGYEHPIERLMASSMTKIKSLVDTDTIIGNPVKTPDGTVVIPVSKVTMGFVTGGGEYSDINNNKKMETFPFAGGSGGGISVSPIGFLVDNGKTIKIMSINGENAYDKLLDIVPELVDSLITDRREKP